ncbi:hypothetical protein [Glycomyces albidus]|jgi:hypothetical protein|uniref:Uncharacterized protein n=1 Tax=Glycomyces albidus TaxID=2656774 RepID=A0A6L5G513_9ACTN|nr:hypothetical protein [Glycomyces albidus]MQM24734.1 hypothetical protein [Glycomyces albidus]
MRFTPYVRIGTVLLTAAAAALFALAAPAHATADQCETYLRNWGYAVGPRLQYACALGAGWEGHSACYREMVAIGIPERRADTACYFAEQPK